MAKLNVFNFMTLNGFYKGDNNDISWHSHEDQEAGEFAARSSQMGGMLLFGRVTYDMMAGFWPTEMAAQQFPEVAEGMNKAEKIVFSNTMKSADWKNTRVVNGDIIAEVRKLKGGDKDMTILGSGSIVSQLAEAGLIDSYILMMDPVAIGSGTTIFNGIEAPLELTLEDVKQFKSGVLLLTYQLK